MKKSEKSLVIESRIDFRQGKNQWKSYFFPHFGFGLKTRSQFRSAGKNQREISGDKVGRLLWSLGGKYAGKGEECNIESELSLLSQS